MVIATQQNLFGNKVKIYKLPKTQYLGSKERLISWIYKNAPKNIDTVLDAFSGTSSVGYHFKANGKQIIGNDFLKFNFHIGKALIENPDQTIDERDIEILFDKNKNKGSLVEDIFTDVFFEKQESIFLDNFRANVNLLENEFKKSLALTIMNRALTRKILLGHFAHTSALRYSRDPERIKRNPTIARPIKDLFLDLVGEYNMAIFDNGRENKFYCENTIDLIPKLKNIDLVYFDPPYCGCHPDYQAFYHFLETYVEYWRDKEFVNRTKSYFPKKESGFVLKTEIINSFRDLFKVSESIPYWLISYNSKSYPEKNVIIDLIKQHKKFVKVYEYEYENHYGGKGSRKGTREYLFYCYN